MSITVIVLAILLIILLYILYLYLSPTNTSLITSASLLTNNTIITKIDIPRTPRYAYGLWLYVNTWTNNSEKTIFARRKNLRLYLDTTTLQLKCDITMNDGTKTTTIITDNYPIQKWCYIVISVDNVFVDFYLDGKLVKSQKLDTSPKQPLDAGDASSDSNANIVLGGSYGVSNEDTTPNYNNFDAVVNNFTRWSSPVNPQTVWNSYVNGNGNNTGILPKMSSYNAKLNILRNNSEYTSFSLF